MLIHKQQSVNTIDRSYLHREHRNEEGDGKQDNQSELRISVSRLQPGIG